MIEFWVPGTPVPQGSSRAFIKGGRAVLVSRTRPLIAWRRAISDEAERTMKMQQPWHGPVTLTLTFYRSPIKDKRKLQDPPTSRPDLDKLIRAALDALTGIVYWDDSQVTTILAEKRWGRPGVNVRATSHAAVQPSQDRSNAQHQLP